tara:strand:- start:728 stop:3151 length:2424 start_codon:yes stop_codon:yes gene_type:complete
MMIKMQHDLIQPPLLDEIKKYLNQIKNNDKVYLFVPYIKTKSLEKLIDGINNEIVIVTNWKENNFLTGSTELSLYPFCNERGIKLYNNEKIHLKVYSINLDSMILATGNISQRGLMSNGNLELGTLIEKISHKDRQFFEQIIQDSSIIDEELYRSREKYLEENRHLKELIEPITIEKDPKDEFLISALPMTRNIAILKNSYDKLNRNMPASNDQEINGCVDADLENYGIPLQLSPDEFEKLLKKKFFEHPFIQRIDKFLTPCGQFGEIKQWIQDNCTDVPIPSRRELTGNVQVLLEWFVKLGDGTYEMDVPGTHSQRLCKKISNELEYQNHSDDEIRNAVLLGLSMPGRTVTEIENEIGRTFSGVNEQQSNRDLSSWHNITEIVLFAAKELNIPDELRLERYPSRPNDDYGPFYMLIVRHIRELRRAGRLIDWDYPRSGIWRLKEITPIISQENPISQFKIGQFYHHDEIWKPLNLGWAGGIRASAKNKLVILFWNARSPNLQRDRDDEFARVNIYEDHFDSKTGLYHYIGEGQVGDQKLESGSGGNKRIVKAKEIGRTIHLFHQHEYDGKHEYLGEVELVETQTTRQNDIDGNDREVFVFLLKPIEKQPVEKQSVQNTVQKNDLDAKLVLFSVSSDAAFEHYQNSLLDNVNTSNFPSSEVKKLPYVRMWGAIDRSGNNNRSKWSKLKKGDILLFFRDKKYVAKMILEGTEDNYEIAKMIWGEKTDHAEMNTKPISGETWQLIMYAKPENITKIDLEDSDLNQLLGYQANFPGPLRAFDFMVVSNEKLKKLEKQYGSIQKALESIGI